MRIRSRHIGFLLLTAAYLAAAGTALWRTTTAVRGAQVTLRISQWQLEGGVRNGIDAVIRRYEELNPHVRVVQIAVPDRVYLPWIMTQMVGGTGPDIVEYSWPWPNTARYFSPLTAEVMQPNPYNRGTPLEGVPWRDTFVDGMTSPDNYVRALGQYYGISMTTGMSRIVYNRALLKTITGREAPPQTYREFVALCAEIQAYARERGMRLAPLANSRTTHFNFSSEILGNLSTGLAGHIDFQHRLKFDPQSLAIAYLRGEWTYDHPELKAGFEVLREVGAQCTPGFLQRERDTALTDFVTGRAVMILAPSWEASSLQLLCDFELGAYRFPFPQADDPVYGRYAHGPFGEGQVVTGMPFYLNRHTKHRAEALDFLRFLGSREGSAIFSRVSDWLPVVSGVQPSAFSAQFQPRPDGQYWQNGFLSPSNQIDALNFTLSVLHTLWSEEGGVPALQAALREGMGDKVREGLRRDTGSALESARREDVAGAAQGEQAAPGNRPETLPLLPLVNEINLYQARVTLVETEGRVP